MMDREDRENLVDFLEEADLNQYYELFRSTLKVTKASQLKFVMTEDLVQIGLSKPEQRRYKKMYSKHFPNPYLAKIRSFFSLSSRRDDASTSRGGAPPLEMQPFPENVVKVPTKHIISIDDITMNKELGMGQFGVVQQGTWSTGNQRIQVAIKCLGQERMTSNSSEFLKEAAVMHTIEHPNIVRLYGVVLHMDSLMLVTELAPLRSLLECLRELSLRPYFPIPNLCDFAEQICDGMTYLEKKRLIHRDLAARNILVFNKDRVKISDFGLSRALGVGKDYYQTNYNVNLKLPVAWCAPECILYLRFTLASDVWAFGVCLWEIFTYGFQPWAAFSGQQILEAIDAPNFQRLERPDCCPEAYYAVMLQCWAHDPAKRPRFKDLKPKLKNIRAEQVQAICDFKKEPDEQRTNLLEFKSGQIITVLGKHDMTKSSFWYGILPGGQSGMFNPDSTKRYVKLEKPPTAVSISPPPSRQSGRSLRTSLQRADVKRQTYTGKRPLQLSMISAPQGDVRHTGHIGADGMFFGDISFLNPEPPRQVVSPYKPSEDLEQVPLINPNSPSHLSAAAASYPMLGSNTPTDDGRSTSRSSNKSHRSMEPTTSKSILNKIAQVKNATLGRSNKSDDNAGSKNDEHEYHEISDTDTESNAADNLRLEPIIIPDSPGIPRSYADFSQSLLAEMESMFRTIDETRARAEPESFRTDVSVVHRSHTMSKAEKKKGAGFDTGTMKPMSAHDQKTLDTACAMANEITTKSMTDLGGESKAAQPPAEKSKFHFRFPHLSINLHGDSDSHDKKGSKDRRNFSDEANSVPNIQESLSEESKRAYVSLIEEPVAYRPPLTLPPEDLLTYPSSPSPPAIPARRPFISVPNPYFRERARSKPKPAYARRAQSEGSLPRNPLPLPPRTTKPKLVDKPRHIRKNALLLSPVGGLPRLAKPPKTPIYQNTPAMLYRSVADDDDDSVDGYLLEEPLSCNEESRDGDDEGELTPKPEEAPLAKDLDHVSVEDLLEFAGVKPCGRQRGIESDEVRIMCKVLKKQVPPETCLQALELNDWNVHNSIKLIYLKLSASPERSLDTCYEQLQAAGGDPANALLALNDLIT